MGDLCERGSQLRPNIVWFGEAVPMMEPAIEATAQADIFLVVGTSLQVYPAASLIQYTKVSCPIFLVDPKKPGGHLGRNVTFIEEKASTGMLKFKELIFKN
jgi:NAD-dependent deacetylase